MSNLIKEFLVINDKYDLLKLHLKNFSKYNVEFYNSYIITDNLKQKINNQLNNIIPTKSRKKRALINALGSIIKSITGNLDQNDAEYLDNNINILKQNQDNLKFVLEKKMTLLDKSISYFQESIKNISHNQKILESRINQIIDTIHTVEIEETNIFEFYRIYVVFSQISMYYQNIYDTLENIGNAINFAKLNTFHSSIINTNSFLNELKFINENLNSEKLPFEPIMENILRLENTLNIKSYVKNNEIFFIIEVPLVEKQPYDLFKLFPLPIRFNKDKYKLIVPNFEYLLINDIHFGYSNQPCKRISLTDFLCNHIHSENYYSNTPCEVQLLKYQNNISDCNTILVNINNMQIQNIDENKWILITNNNVIGIEQCEDKQNKILFNGTYLLELGFPCSLKLGDVIIKSFKNVKHIFQNIPLPNIDIDIRNRTLYKEVKLVNLNNINFNKLDSLQKEINLQKYENLKLMNIPIYYNRTSFWTVLLYIIICVVFIIILWKYLRPIYLKIKKPKNISKDSIVI